MKVRARAPARLGFGGGGTDVSPYCDEYGGVILNATVNLYAHTTLETRVDGRVSFVAVDFEQSFESAADADFPLEEPLGLHRAVYRRVTRQFNDGKPFPCTLTTHCDAPPGAGLGSSSTMVVSMVKAFIEMLNLPLGEYEVGRLAYEIERKDLGLAGGRQDQYAATFGGFNYMEFYGDERIIVNPLRIKNWILSELESSLLLFYTGVSRDSSAIIQEQVGNVRRQNIDSIEAMH